MSKIKFRKSDGGYDVWPLGCPELTGPVGWAVKNGREWGSMRKVLGEWVHVSQGHTLRSVGGALIRHAVQALRTAKDAAEGSQDGVLWRWRSEGLPEFWWAGGWHTLAEVQAADEKHQGKIGAGFLVAHHEALTEDDNEDAPEHVDGLQYGVEA